MEDSIYKMNLYKMSIEEPVRRANPEDIALSPGYRIEVFMQGLDAPSNMLFTRDGAILIAISGYLTGRAQVLKFQNNQMEVLADDLEAPLLGVAYFEGDVYVSHFNRITVIKRDGTKKIIIGGLPTIGDNYVSNIVFGSDGKLYFGIGSVTNSGVVGLDNAWIQKYPFLCDYLGGPVILVGQNFKTIDAFTRSGEVYTGAFSPYGIKNIPYEVRKGTLKASGSILKANPDGSRLEMVAWGFRYPCFLRFDSSEKLYVSNQGCDVRGSRPIANSPDEFQLVTPGTWYGWPDYTGGEPVTLPKFKPEGGVQPEFLMLNHPGIPPRPIASFQNKSYIVGFDFNDNKDFGNPDDIYIAEFGSGGKAEERQTTPFSGTGHRVSKINRMTGVVTTFAINRSGFPSSVTGEGGFGRPIQALFGPDGALYILDMGTNSPLNPSELYPNSGIIWRISKI